MEESPDSYSAELNRFGKAGWELVTVVYLPEKVKPLRAYLKRRRLDLDNESTP
jgi:hypothetical protein